MSPETLEYSIFCFGWAEMRRLLLTVLFVAAFKRVTQTDSTKSSRELLCPNIACWVYYRILIQKGSVST